MSPAQPQGDPAPLDGSIPVHAVQGLSQRCFSLYVHVPFCSVRCGYCDFNTYSTDDFGQGIGLSTYANDAIAEIEFAQSVLSSAQAPQRPLHSIFFGGGTPTKLPVQDLIRIFESARDVFGLADQAEVTTEANPDSVSADDLKQLAQAGFTRVSFGMQSAVPEILAVLDRTHTPSNLPKVVQWAKEAGLQVSVDLIYGAPTETLEQWIQSVDAAISYQPDHISAYSLIVEEGTKLAAQIRRGEYEMPDNDLMADMYEVADTRFRAAGYNWYEVSNYSRSVDTRSKHNFAYWNNQDWWGIGPGAHSHLNGVRWWNLKHPVPYAHRVRAHQSPAAAREVLSAQTRQFENIMLQVRTIEGLALAELAGLHDAQSLDSTLTWLSQQELIETKALECQRIVLTDKGRLLGDMVTRELL